MRRQQHLKAVAVRGNEAAKSPFLAQHTIQQPVVDVRRNAVNFVIGSHHASGPAFAHGGFERNQEDLPNDAFRIVAGRGVGAAFGLAVPGEMFGRRQDMMAVDEERISLQPLDRGHAHARSQKRILTVRFFGTSPAWIAGDVENWGEDLARSRGARFFAGGGKYLLDKFRIPGAGQAQRLREAGAAVFHESVQRLSHEQCRNAEASLLAKVALHAIAQDRRAARGKRAIGVPPPAERLARLLAVKRPRGIDDLGLSFAPAGNLLDLFFQRHARQLIGNAVVDGEIGIAVFGIVVLRICLVLPVRWHGAQCCAQQGLAKE
jgi:hypothetical protein